MSSPFIGEIRMFGCNFCPRNWAFCNGQILQIAQNVALFSLLGTSFGGNGTTTYALPDLRGRAPLHRGQGTGLSNYFLGATGGAANVTLLATHLPNHTHTVLADNAGGGITTPTSNAIWSAVPRGHPEPYAATPGTSMHSNSIGTAGGGQPHNNLPPYLAVNFCIAQSGLYPTRSS